MEEKTGSSASLLKSTLHRETSTTKIPPLSPLRPQTPGRINQNNNAQTIVVQVPRDQIHRAIPPENADLISHYNLQQEEQCRFYADKKINIDTGYGTGIRRFWNKRRMFYLLVALFVLLVVLLIGLFSIYTFISPEVPNFSVTRVRVDGYGTTKKIKHPTYKFEVTLKKVDENPSSPILDHDFRKKGSKAVLFHGGLKMASGDISLPAVGRTVVDNRESSFSFRAVMFSSKHSVVPDDVKKSVEKNHSGSPVMKNGIGLVLFMEVPVRLKIGRVQSWNFNMKIKCRFRVRFSKGERKTHLLHQQCKTKLWS